MASSFDCVVSSLLCAEEGSCVFDEIDDGVAVNQFEDGLRLRRYGMVAGGEQILTTLPIPTDESVASMINKECEHLPASDYLKRLKNGDLDVGTRLEAVDWIHKVHSHCNFGPLCLYLSINYLDRFLSVYEIPAKTWMMQLVAVACLALAAKLEESDVPLSLDMQVGIYPSKFIFEGKTVQRMELLVLNTLKWRMQAVTPFSFIDYFLKKLNDDQTSSRALIARATHLIISVFKGIDFLEYRSSEIAAAVAISVLGEAQSMDIEAALSTLVQDEQKEKVFKCLELIKGLSSLMDFPMSTSSSSFPESPNGVLEASCFSCKTDDGSCASSSEASPVPKRRRLEMDL